MNKQVLRILEIYIYTVYMYVYCVYRIFSSIRRPLDKTRYKIRANFYELSYIGSIRRLLNHETMCV